MMHVGQRMRIASLLVLAAFLLAACGSSSSASATPTAGAAAGGGQAVTVNVTLTDFHVQSSLTTFKVGTPYHFVVVNKGAVAHEFDIVPPEPGSTAHAQIVKDALAMLDSSKLAPGGTATLDYTFTQAAASGKLQLACHVPGHYDQGMHQDITVQ